MTIHLTTATDLRAAIANLRSDVVAALGHEAITADWCRAQMHDLGITRYEDVDAETLSAIADRVDTLVS